jgi:lysophospholipase L1-like esterase
MATLTQGQSVTIQVAEGEAWTITPVGQAKVSTRGISGAALQQPTAISVATVFGPYTESGIISIEAVNGACDYTQSGAVVTASSDGGLVTYVPSSGYRTVLFGDSMTDTYETIVPASGVAYDSNTGIATVTSAGHQQATGWYVYLWNRNYTSTIQGWRVAATRVDANNFTVQLPAGLAGVPASAATWLYRPESWRSAQAFVPWLQAVSGQRFNIIKNGALSGDTTQNALDRLQRDCLAYNPQVVIMQTTGINDTSPGNGNIKEDTIFANQCSIVDQILARGARLVLLSLTPVAASETAGRGTLVNMARVQRLNARMRAYVQNKPGVTFFDAYRRIVNPTDTTGLALTNYLRTTDKIHYSMRGGKFIADQLWSQVSGAFPSDYSSLPVSAIDNFWSSALSLTSVARSGGVVTGTSASHNCQVGERMKLAGGSESFNEYVTITAVTTNTVSFVTASGADGSITGTIRLSRNTNLVPNCVLATTTGGSGVAGSGTSSGTFAGNIRVNNTAGTPGHVGSVVARSDGYGNSQRVVITPASASDQVIITSDFTTYNTDLPLLVKAGRTYVFECALDLTNVSGSNLSEIRVNIAATVDSVTYQTYALNGYSDGATLNSDATSLHVKTAPFVMPAGSTFANIQWQVLLAFSASGTAITVDLGRMRLSESE